MKPLLGILLAALASLAGCAAQAARITADPLVLDGAFRPGFTVVIPDRKGRVGFRIVELGRLKVTSGRIVAADPLVAHDAEPFTFSVPAGEYPVRLAVADLGQQHFRVALARIDFRDTPTVRWEMALREGESLRKLKSGHVYGYPVDAGIGSFGDADAFAWLKSRTAAAGGSDEALYEQWFKAGDGAAEAMGLPHRFLLMAEAGSGNIALFNSGWGDGHYASWVGYDAQGRVTALVTDFAVVTAVKGL